MPASSSPPPFMVVFGAIIRSAYDLTEAHEIATEMAKLERAQPGVHIQIYAHFECGVVPEMHGLNWVPASDHPKNE